MSGPSRGKRCEEPVSHKRLSIDPKSLSRRKPPRRQAHVPLLPGLVQGLEQLREEHEKKLKEEEKRLREEEKKREKEEEGE
jgi:hypothetical protein